MRNRTIRKCTERISLVLAVLLVLGVQQVAAQDAKTFADRIAQAKAPPTILVEVEFCPVYPELKRDCAGRPLTRVVGRDATGSLIEKVEFAEPDQNSAFTGYVKLDWDLDACKTFLLEYVDPAAGEIASKDKPVEVDASVATNCMRLAGGISSNRPGLEVRRVGGCTVVDNSQVAKRPQKYMLGTMP